jgi:hypothetical protein
VGTDDLQRQRQQVVEKYKNRRETGVSAVETVRELGRLDALLQKAMRRCKE